MSTQTRQQINSLGETYFLMEDQNVLQLVLQNKPELFPVISRLNSTSKIEDRRDRELLELYLEDMILHEEMNLDQDADPSQLQFLKALRYYGIFRILDAMKGYRGELVTEVRERTLIETAERKKKGWL